MNFVLVFWLLVGSAILPSSLTQISSETKCKRASDGEEGVCLSANECFEISKNTFKGNITMCGIDKQTPLVCCFSKLLEQPPETAVALSFSSSSKPSKDVESTSRKKCQEYARLIYVGEDVKTERCTIRADSKKIGRAVLGEFPHMVSFLYISIHRPNKTSNNCAGSLISEKFVLTAAHCISTKNSAYGLRLVAVLLGAVNLSTNATDKPQVIPVAQVILHPDFRGRSRDPKFDIGLVKLKSAPILGPLVRPACLPLQYDDFSSRELVLTGWGTTRTHKGFSKTLNKVVLYEAPYHICNDYYSRKRVEIHGESMLCAGHPILKSDACQGDSGGPLQVISMNAHCMYTITAITSFGDGKCGSGNPGIYTRVQYFRRWIENIIWD